MNPEEKIPSPKGSFLKRNKTVLTIAAIAVIALAAIAGVLLLRPGSADKGILAQTDLTPTPGQEIPSNLKTIKVKEEPTETVGFELKKPFDLVPEDSDETGTATDGGYRILLGSYDYTAQELTNKITISPQTAFTINQTSSGEFLLQPSFLKPNQIYSISFSDADEGISYSWAFQTRKEFFVVRTLPRDKATYVPVNSGIEVTFSQKAENALSSWFEISPYVSGRFEIHKDTVVFVADKPFEYDTIYTITVKKGYPQKTGGMELKEDTIFSFQTEPAPLKSDTGYSCDSFEFARRVYNFYPYEQPLLSVYTNIESTAQVEFSLYKYDNEENFKNDISTKDDRPFWCVHYDKPISYEGKEQVLSMSTSFLQEEGEGSYYSTKFLQIPQTLPEGHYIAVIRKDEQERCALVQINALAAYVGAADNKTIAMVYESETAQPMAGVQIVFDSFTLRTGKDGLAVSDNVIFTEDSSSIINYVIRREGHPSYFATLGSSYYSSNYYYNYEDYYGYSDNFYYGDINDLYWGYLFTDRDMYMPSDTVNIWGMLAGKDGSTTPGKVRVVLSHGYSLYNGAEDYAIIDETEARLTGTNTFKASFSYKNISQGYYSLEVFSGDKRLLTKEIFISKYVKPIYTISTGLSQKNVMSGDKVEFTMETSFFEGTPVAGMNFNYYTSGLYSGADNGTLTTDENGKAALSLSAIENSNGWYPRSAVINVSNADPEETSVNAYESLTIFPRDTMIQVESRTRDNAADDLETCSVEVEANRINIEGIRNKDWYLSEEYKGEPADIPIEVDLYEIWYTATQTGTYYNFITKQTHPQYRYDRHENKFQTIQLNTVNGKASFEFTREKEKGYYAILRCKDGKGREIVQQENFYSYYYNNYNDWRSMTYYHLENDRQFYSAGDTARLSLYNGENPVEREENSKLLFMLYRKGLMEYALTGETTWQVTFRENYIPNAGVMAVYFDGKNFKTTSMQSLHFNQDDRKLNISVTPSKQQYRPGETAVFDIDVTDMSGKGRKAEILFSMVDEAFFALRDQSVDILYSLYNQNVSTGYKGGSIPHTNTLEDYDYFGGAECGEGGDGGASDVRSDFRDTALFDSVTTDENGHSQISVMLPDNLTKWRVTYLGLTNDLYAGSGIIQVNARLPYFINTVFHDVFITGDQPVLQMRSFGTEVSDDARVDYTVRIEKDGEVWKEASAYAPAGQRATVQLDPLPEGNYTFTVRGKYKEYEDAIQLPFEVLPGFVEQTLTEYQTLAENTVFPQTKWPARLYFINENVKPYWNELLELAYSWNNRIDSIVVRKQAKKLLQEFFKDTAVKDRDEYDTSNYQLDNGGIALLPYDSADPVLTAKICSLNDSSFDYDLMKQYFYRVMTDENSTSTHIAAAYWGLACLREPVLLQLNELVKDTGLKLIDKLYIALAYAYAGDIDTANTLYQEMVQSYLKEDTLRAYITMEEEGYDSDDIQEATSLCALLAQKVNGAERDKFFEFVRNMYTTDILTSAIRLTSIKSNLKNLNLESSFTWELDGKKEAVTIKGRETYSMFLTAEKLQNIRFSNVKGSIIVSAVYSAPLGEVAKTDARIAIDRTYSDRNGNVKTTFNASEYIKVTLNVTFEPTAPTGRYMVEDYLPASLRYVSNWGEADQWVQGDGRTWYPHERSGQKVSFSVYHNNNDKTPTETITYYARVYNYGEFTADNAAVYNLESNVINYAPRVRITVK